MGVKKLCTLAMFLIALGCAPSDVCKVGRMGDCPQGTVCVALGEDITDGTEGRCKRGELNAEGRLRITLDEWKISRADESIVPLRLDAAELGASDTDNPKAGWLGTGAAELFLEASGSADVETRLEVLVGNAPCTSCSCKPVAGHCQRTRCKWECELPAGWAGEGPVAQVAIRLGEQGFQRTRSYRVTTKPQIRMALFELAQPMLAGDEVRLCAMREEEGAVPVREWEIQSLKLSGTSETFPPWEVPVQWRRESEKLEEFEEAFHACWKATVPLAARIGAGAVQLNAEIVAKDASAADILVSQSLDFQLGRIHCNVAESLPAGKVTEPLAFTSAKELVFGAGEHLYFYNQSCQSAGTMHPGTVKGPMVVIGNSGRMAIGIKERPAGSPNRSRLALVNTDNKRIVALGEAPTGDVRNCIPPSNMLTGADLGFTYDRGLGGLARLPPNSFRGERWHLLAVSTPTHSAFERDDARLVMMVIDKDASSFIACDRLFTGHLWLPPIRMTQDRVAGRGEPSSDGIYANRIFSSEINLEYDHLIPAGIGEGTRNALLLPTGFAAAGEHVWLSGQDGLQRWNWELVGDNPQESLVTVLSESTSPAAVDSERRAYVVVKQQAGYELRRFKATPIATDIPADNFVPRIPGPAVGSPLLGQPLDDSPAEVYVVTEAGTVLAFHAETLEPLWTVELGIPIAPTAQPALAGNMLWTVGTGGQVRALRVASNGLSRSATWPKTFRDNCNTASATTTFADMPSCF